MARLLALVGLALVVSALLPGAAAAHDHRRRYYAPSYPYYDDPRPPRYCYPEAPWGHRYWDAHNWECYRGRWYYRGRPW